MGLSPSAVRFLVREHSLRPFRGPVLTLGRQSVHATHREIVKILASEKLQPQPIDELLSLRSNIPHWRGTEFEKYASDKVLFGLLGIRELLTLDVSAYENA